MSIEINDFGKTVDGRDIHLYTITNSNGVVLNLTDLGACWVGILVPDKDGKLDDVCLGLLSGSEYETGSYDAFGAIVGRSANRIWQARFNLNGREYRLVDNDLGKNLHSGPDFYYTRLWNGNAVDTESGEGVEFSLHSPDGDQCMPGNIDITVTYILTEDNSVIIEYRGLSDADTLFNMTNHAYFNLGGHKSGTIDDEKVWIDADYFTYGMDGSTSDGNLYTVVNTPADFRQLKRLGDELHCDERTIVEKGGYDHNFVLKNNGELELVAKCVDEKSGRYMDIFTDMPGLMMYTGNYINTKNKGKDGAVYHPFCGVAFETQYWPDAINHENFPSPVIKAGEEKISQTIYHFGVLGDE